MPKSCQKLDNSSYCCCIFPFPSYELIFSFLIYFLHFQTTCLQSSITDCLIHSPYISNIVANLKLLFPNLYVILETGQPQRIHWIKPHYDILYVRINEKKRATFLFPISYLSDYQQKYHSQHQYSAQQLATWKSSFPYQQVAVLIKTNLQLQYLSSGTYKMEMA